MTTCAASKPALPSRAGTWSEEHPCKRRQDAALVATHTGYTHYQIAF